MTSSWRPLHISSPQQQASYNKSVFSNKTLFSITHFITMITVVAGTRVQFPDVCYRLGPVTSVPPLSLLTQSKWTCPALTALIERCVVTGIRETPWWRHDIDALSVLLAFCVERPRIIDGYKELAMQNLMISLLLARIYFWANNRLASEMKRLNTHPTSP